jgi:site-specific DNA recombinase
MNFCYCGLHALMASCERGATTQSIKAFARTARKRMRIEGGGYRRDYLRALAQHVEVDAQELRIMGSKSEPIAGLQERISCGATPLQLLSITHRFTAW